jgi:tetratricopeptide (TPR) repeat protein
MKQRNSVCYWLFVVSYWLFLNYSPSSIFNLQNTVTAAETNKTILNNLASATDPNSNFKKELLRIELNMPEVEKEEITKSELRKMIEQIRSIDIAISKEVFEPVVVPNEVPKNEPNEPNEAALKKDVEEKLKKEKVKKQSSSNGMVSSQTLEILKKLSQDPNNLENPFELGETLFLSGYMKEAVIFYREALKRENPEKANFARNRAWILFQIGNCLRDGDKPEAIKVYGQLITEYPNSPWKELAEVRKALMDWYLKEEPGKLIKEREK